VVSHRCVRQPCGALRFAARTSPIPLIGTSSTGPRGRIYVGLPEAYVTGQGCGAEPESALTVAPARPTCPSGGAVRPPGGHRRNIVENAWPAFQRIASSGQRCVPYPETRRVRALFKVGQFLRPLVAGRAQTQSAEGRAAHADTVWPEPRHAAQDADPGRNACNPRCARHQSGDGAGVGPAWCFVGESRAAGCCGAVTFHLNRQENALDYMRANHRRLVAHIEAGRGRVVMTASGCGTMVKEYGHVPARDPAYAEKAKRVSELTKET